MSTRVEIPCPRCSGRGVGNWHPDNGVCYRCKGHRYVTVDVQKYEAALRFLRAKYVRLLHATRSGPLECRSLAQELLRYCVQDGLRVRADLEEAKAALS